MPFALPARSVLLRRIAIGLGALLLLWAMAWLAVPPILKSQAQQRLSEMLGRPVTIGAVDFRPWSLELTLRDVAIGGASAGDEPPLRWSRAYANADAASIWRLAPVIGALEIDGLQIRVARVADGRYDIDDLIARLTPAPDAPPADGEPVRFALYNLRLSDTTLVFDDRPAQRVHRVEALQLALPFVSSLPAHLEVTVEPRLAFRLDGASFDSGAQATPFAQRQRGELRLAFDGLDLARYAPYLPASLPVRLRQGVLGADLALQFELPDGADPIVRLSGSTTLAKFGLTEADGAPLLDAARLHVGLRDVQPLRRRVALAELALDGARLQLARAADGRVNVQRLGGSAAALPAAPTPAAPTAPWQIELDRLAIDEAGIAWTDAAVRPAAALRLDGLRIRGEKIAWPAREPVPLSLAATLRGPGEADAPAGQLNIDARASDREASGTLALEGLAFEALASYVAQSLQPRLLGRASAKGRFAWSADPQAPKTELLLDELTLDAPRLVSGSGRNVRDEIALKQLVLADLRIDLPAREVSLGRATLTQPALAVLRDGQGRWNLAQLLLEGDVAAPAAAAPAASAPAWSLRLKDLQIDGGRLRLADSFAAGRAAEKPVQLDASALRLRVQDLAWPAARGTPPARVQFGARLASGAGAGSAAAGTGSVDFNGRLAPDPLLAAGRLRIERFALHAFMPYLDDRLPLAVLRAEAQWNGDIDVRQAAAGWSVNASGDARLAEVRVHTKADTDSGAGDELLSWQSFALDGIRVAMAPQSTPQIEVREAALNDFFARLVVTEQGRLNLNRNAPAAAAEAPAAPASAASAASTAAQGGEPPVALAVGGVKLNNGRIDFSDRFIRPNYSANLTELNGALGAFRTGSREMATLELRGRAAGTALLDVRGALNPTADPLALDIQAKATDLELAPLSPYAGKYAGYAIERGKLSMEVAYKIAPDGRLEARNQVVLNQLTFGDKVDSPDATKLPVLLAVALLKDRNGVIDINLPISGSINDPQFSVFGIVLKVIGNLLVKALTAPFALLAGGGGEDLSVVEFRPGTAMLADSGRGTLDKVAKALADRDALKMTVTGSADAAAEAEALRQAALEARLLAERRRELLRDGATAAQADALSTLDAATRERVLRAVYRAADIPDKPRNALRMLRDIPPAEMEALLRRHIAAGPDAMRELALQRGLAVRDALIAQGLPGERLFLAAPKLGGEGARPASALLSLSTN